jgi:hypothetical protein
MVYANGQPASISWKWEFVRPADEDDEQPPEGFNHLRIDVISEWTDFDPTNLPTPNKDYRLMLKDPVAGYITDYHWHPSGWIYGNSKNLNTITETGLQYKLIKL